MAYKAPFNNIIKPERMGNAPLLQVKDIKEKKEAEALTEQQKYRMAATAVGEDPSFTLKTFDDPRSGRSIVETKRALKKKNPELYQDLYGKQNK